MTTTDIIVAAEPVDETKQVLDPHAEDPAQGKWYWYTDDDGDKHLACVVHLGSNYVRLKTVAEYAYRVHVNEFFQRCAYEPDADGHIDRTTVELAGEVRLLMQKVRQVTARLAMSQSPELTAGHETYALATVNKTQDIGDYKTALVKAKDKELPELFKRIKTTNEQLAIWMGAKLIPLITESENLDVTIEAVKDRIFSVELYAGLSEKVKLVRDGEPAELGQKIYLMQRRAYMDEECLAAYETGGMSFEGIEEFDTWLAKPKNLNRILPHKRCIIAFRVRRHRKEREVTTYTDYVRVTFADKEEKKTFLYIRNGEQLFRMSTEIEFDAKLFPDMDAHILNRGKAWAKVEHAEVKSIITDDDYQVRLEQERAKTKEEKEEDRSWRRKSVKETYSPFTKDNVYYDDIKAHLDSQDKRHNRLVLVLQGLLDRSPVLHPHPPWSLWSNDGFQAALELVYDDNRALVSGDAPDFKAYFAKLAASIQEGTVTLGQEKAWLDHERELAAERRDKDLGTWWRPNNDKGPGKLAKVVKVRGGKCTFEWNRGRRNAGYENKDVLRASIAIPKEELFNVDAYTPGDFHLFFDDPRTREDYVQWAPFLLEAEEYHAGNREVKPVVAPPPPKVRDPEKAEEYQRKKALREEQQKWIGAAVRLRRDITMKSGTVYKEDSLWRVENNHGKEFLVRGILEDGTYDPEHRVISNLERYSWLAAYDIPDAPKKDPK